jgi:septal ring factor EnvC (AmiA/AmiB activator)
MKYAIFLLLTFPDFATAQNNEVGKQGTIYNINLDRTFLIRKDTSEGGVITFTFSPTSSIITELELRLEGLNKEVLRFEQKQEEIDTQQSYLQAQIKELIALIAQAKSSN